MYPAWSKIALTAGLIASATAQTYSECNPMKKSCSPNDGLASSSYSVDFTKGADDDNWETSHGSVKYGSDGVEFTVAKQGDAPTLQSKWYMLFGRLEVHMKAAPGTGIVSSVVLLSDVLDEVDWEWLGGKGDDVQTNYYGKGNTEGQDTRSASFPATNNQAEFHNYTIHWTKDSCEWYINNVAVRTLKFADAAGGENYPQTPMRVKLGIWAGGDPDNAEGTIEWAGGETDYSGGPYTMTVQKIKIENLNPAESYSYSDETGSYESIKFDKKDNGSSDDSDDDDDDDKSSTTAETASKTSSEATSKSSTETGTKTEEASTTESSDDFKNNKAAETSDADTTSASASATTASSTNSAAGNWPKMWLALGATCAAMVMM